jgi:hypothetical protein
MLLAKESKSCYGEEDWFVVRGCYTSLKSLEILALEP